MVDPVDSETGLAFGPSPFFGGIPLWPNRSEPTSGFPSRRRRLQLLNRIIAQLDIASMLWHHTEMFFDRRELRLVLGS